MALLLNIDTATELASVCISVDGVAVAVKENDQQKEHASFIHQAIDEIVKEAGVDLKILDAISVTSGPGSYTGLRVGMATVKGLCYALSKPMITINTLQVMTQAALEQSSYKNDVTLFCPMIDARRLEVFTAIYDSKLQCIMKPQALILDSTSFDAFLSLHKILFFGSGSAKFSDIKVDDNSIFEVIDYSAAHLALLAEGAFGQQNFSDISYSQPDYFKNFYSTTKAK